MSFSLATRMARTYAESNMTAEVYIWRPDVPELDPGTGVLTATVETGVYRGKARIYTVSGPMPMGIGDESQEFQTTYASIPISTADGITNPRPDDVLEVTAHPDPLMVGRHFRVRDVDAGGQMPAVRRMELIGAEAGEHWVDSNAPAIPAAWLS